MTMGTDTDTVYCLEALLRWQHPVHGLISPNTFIPIAEETGLIRPIGLWVLHQALTDLRNWRGAGHPNLRIAINVSSVQLTDPGFVDDVRQALTNSQTPPGNLVVELTESTLVEHADAEDRLHRLRGLGVCLSIDDFGTGYSSLSYLRRLKVDSVKIDRSFIAGIADDADTMTLVRSIIDMSHAQELTVVAEGIEHDEQQALLRDNDCDLGQGFLLARPLRAEAASCLLSTRAPASTFPEHASPAVGIQA
jgi:EAL domain-containing protein (putative c-di-GMP-specific phosphodiesterase class I)